MSLLLTDALYGESNIVEPILIDLLQCDAILRLKGVEMSGHFMPWFPVGGVTRYDHSVGVMLLLRKFGASVSEQIAGLLHDISHTAFSHSVDYALNKAHADKQNYQDLLYDKILHESDVAMTLRKHGYDPDDFSDLEKFPLLEKAAPDLCADRLDYSLRQMYNYAKADPRFSQANVRRYLEHLRSNGTQWYFADPQVALAYAKDFGYLSDEWFADVRTAKMFATTADCLEYAIRKKYLREDELQATDAQICERIQSASETDPELGRLWRRMDGVAHIMTDPPYTHTISCKSRVIDPLSSQDGMLHKTSDLFPDWKRALTTAGKPRVWQLNIRD